MAGYKWYDITNVTFDNVGTLNFTEHAEQISPLQLSNLSFWRLISTHDSLTKSDIEQMAIINSNKNLELKFINKPKTSSLTNNSGSGLTLNYFSAQQYGWDWNIIDGLSISDYRYEFTIKRPDTDALIFTFGEGAFDNNGSNNAYIISALTLYFKNNKFYLYLAQTRTDLSDILPPYAFISQINTSPVSAGTYHKFRLDQENNYGGSFITVYFDDIKILSLTAESSSGPGDPDKYNYRLNGEKANPLSYYKYWNKSIDTYDDNDSSSTVPFFYWGTAAYSLSHFITNWNFNDWGYTLSTNVNVMDTIGDATSPRRTDFITYIKDPLPAQDNLTLSFPLNPGNKIEIKDIKISANVMERDFYYDFLIDIDTRSNKDFVQDLLPISISIKEDFETSILDPITVDVGEDVIKDLFTITVPVKEDFSIPILDPIILEVQLDKSETDLFNITLDVDAPVYQLELGPEFVSGWDDRKYLVFRNGHLLPKQTYNIIIPSHHNNYLKKILYSTVGFSKGDRIEVFYIENQENFANVPFNRETRVASYIYYAKSNNQKLIKIPYPNSSYRRSKDSFYLFNDKGEHLDCRYDYTVSADGRYVTLADHAKLKVMMLDYVVFTFCYVQNRSIDGQEDETDMFDNNNVSEIKYSYSYSIQNLTDTTGLVKFTPVFTGWPNMRQDNFMLFGNSVFIEPERYELVSNNQIQFLDPTEQQIANKRRYVMCIPIKETKPQNLATNQIRYEIKLLENTGTTNKSTFILQPPTVGTEWYPFLIFRGTRLMDVEDEYVYDDVNNILQITDSTCYLKPGRHLVVVYLDKSYTNLKKDIRYIKMQLEVDSSGSTTIPDYLYKNPNIQFNSSNLLVFINGVFLEPERYTIEPGNVIKLDPDPAISGYEEPYEDALFTAIYLLEFPDTDANMEEFNAEYGQKEVDPSEDNDETRFDEMYSYVKKKE